jgi:putative DNA primase/helicase
MRPRDAAEVAKVLGSAHRCGLWWRCHCPAHQSRGASLALRDGERGLIVKCFAGCDPRDILAELRRRGLIGDAAHDRHRPLPATTRPDERGNTGHRIAIAQRIWDAAQDARGTHVVPYFAGRLITIPPPPVLRYAPALRRQDGSYGPAMVARIDDLDGGLIGVHRTWLARDQVGAWRRRDRASLGPIGGGAVRLTPAAETLMIGEGIETCLSAMQATGMPAWAGLSTSGMVALILPPIVRTVIILADHDRNGAGERAARTAAQRWLDEGRRVRIALPPEPDMDMADVLAGRAHARIPGACDAAA